MNADVVEIRAPRHRLAVAWTRGATASRLHELAIEEVGVERGQVELPGRLVDEGGPARPRVVGQATEDPFQSPLDLGLSQAHRTTVPSRSSTFQPSALGKAQRLGRT